MRRENKKLYEDRVRAFLERFKKRTPWFVSKIPFTVEYAMSKEPVSFSDRLSMEYKPIKEGEKWGEAWDSAWFKLSADVPAEFSGKPLAGRLNMGGEACIFDEEGCPIYGLSVTSVFDQQFDKDIYRLSEAQVKGGKVELWIEAAANHLFGITQNQDPVQGMPNIHGEWNAKLIHAQFAIYDDNAWHYFVEVEILDNLMRALDDDEPRRLRILKGLNDSITLYQDNAENIPACREALKPLLESPASASTLTGVAVGHAHIDTGWLWPVRETIRKCARTFSSQIALIEKYPQYIFGCSAPQHYQFMKDHYPALYEKIKKAVKSGNWEPQGGMWVEADCNIISGESMVRQFLIGKNFFMDELGFDVRNLWIPDVFGYSASMPQIMKKAGVDFFLTQKISWSRVNTFPHNTFHWEGIDGSSVISHFPPENTYNSMVEPSINIPAQKRFRESDFLDEYMSLYGIGDGGGGVKEELVERVMIQENLEGTPKMKFGRADEFFDGVQKRADELETWRGELYLECHQGTFTSHARIKKGNRNCENRLREVEFIYSCLPYSEYPWADIDAMWKKVLINQFHDIIPGSSIKLVNEVTEREYAECLAKCDELLDVAAGKLFSPEKDSVVLFNSLSGEYTQPIVFNGDWAGCAVLDENGNELPCQSEGDNTSVLVSIPAQSFITLRKGEKLAKAEKISGLVLENDLVCYKFAEDGTLVEAFDKEAGREIINEGEAGNVLSLYEDRPNLYDAWDVDRVYETMLMEKASGVSVEGLYSGKVRSGIRFTLKIGESEIVQNVTLSLDSKRLEFATTVDWKEEHRMLRTAFPVAISSEYACFDIQYGYVKRKTTDNASWEEAQYEVAAHTYADLSDNSYGVALLNDCKYGHKVKGNTLDLNLLRSPRYPDPDADKGVHTFTYAILPHTGRLPESAVKHEAAMLNRKPVVFKGCSAADKKAESPCSIDSDTISLEVVKKAEKEDCLILRLVEVKGDRATGTIKFAKQPKKVVECDLMEWKELAELEAKTEVDVSLTHFEIKTLKVCF